MRYVGQGKEDQLPSSTSMEGPDRPGWVQQSSKNSGPLIFDSKAATPAVSSSQPALWFRKRSMQGGRSNCRLKSELKVLPPSVFQPVPQHTLDILQAVGMIRSFIPQLQNLRLGNAGSRPLQHPLLILLALVSLLLECYLIQTFPGTQAYTERADQFESNPVKSVQTRDSTSKFWRHLSILKLPFNFIFVLLRVWLHFSPSLIRSTIFKWEFRVNHFLINLEKK